MYKQTNKHLRVILFGFLSIFTANIFAQNTDSVTSEQSTKTCLGEKFVMRGGIAVGSHAFVNYLQVASLSMRERKDAFRKLSNEDKAAFIKVNLALQFVKRPNLTKVQQEFVLDSISKISADIFDKSDSENSRRSEQIGVEIENKAFTLFTHKDAGDFVEPLNTNKSVETALLQKYEDLLKSGTRLRRQLVKEMPMNERVNIWKTQMAYHLATSTIDKKQKKFIVEFIPRIQEILEASASLSNDEKAKYVTKLEASIFEIFTKAEAFAIFMEVGIQRFVKDDYAERPDSLQFPCDCRWWCSGDGTYCSQGSCYLYAECGPLGDWNCTGKCVMRY